MSGDFTALVIAVVAVLGTLSASIVTQRLSARAQQQSFEFQRLLRIEEYDRGRREAILAADRSCYVTMLATSQRYRIELVNHLHTIQEGTVNDTGRDSLENARQAYAASFAETELTATVSVLTPVRSVNRILSESFRAIKHLERGEPEPDHSFEEIRTSLLQTISEPWVEMRGAMRDDLGVAD